MLVLRRIAVPFVISLYMGTTTLAQDDGEEGTAERTTKQDHEQVSGSLFALFAQNWDEGGRVERYQRSKKRRNASLNVGQKLPWPIRILSVIDTSDDLISFGELSSSFLDNSAAKAEDERFVDIEEELAVARLGMYAAKLDYALAMQKGLLLKEIAEKRNLIKKSENKLEKTIEFETKYGAPFQETCAHRGYHCGPSRSSLVLKKKIEEHIVRVLANHERWGRSFDFLVRWQYRLMGHIQELQELNQSTAKPSAALRTVREYIKQFSEPWMYNKLFENEETVLKVNMWKIIGFTSETLYKGSNVQIDVTDCSANSNLDQLVGGKSRAEIRKCTENNRSNAVNAVHALDEFASKKDNFIPSRSVDEIPGAEAVYPIMKGIYIMSRRADMPLALRDNIATALNESFKYMLEFKYNKEALATQEDVTTFRNSVSRWLTTIREAIPKIQSTPGLNAELRWCKGYMPMDTIKDFMDKNNL